MNLNYKLSNYGRGQLQKTLSLNGENKAVLDFRRCVNLTEASKIILLIESAPAMYEALNAAYAALQECVPFDGHQDPGAIDDIRAQIRETLAAATPVN